MYPCSLMVKLGVGLTAVPAATTILVVWTLVSGGVAASLVRGDGRMGERKEETEWREVWQRLGRGEVVMNAIVSSVDLEREASIGLTRRDKVV